jgi:hypothetical protein
MNITNKIIDNLNNPQELEKIYREKPDDFNESFSYAWKQYPDSPILSVWYERLNYNEKLDIKESSLDKKDIYYMLILAVLAGTITRIMLYYVEIERISPANLLYGVLPIISVYFARKNPSKRNVLYTLISLFFISVVYLNMLPLEQKDSIILVYLHLPIFLWFLMGLAYTGDEYNKTDSRLSYLKFNGEFCIIYAAFAITGMILTALTMQLFSFIGMDISEFYFENVVIFGAAALAIVSAVLVTINLKLAKNIAPYIAKIFSPLVLVTLLVYLAVAIRVGENPFIDRNFLLLFNGILITVLAVTIFSIIESGNEREKNIFDYVNLALIILALLIDSVALSAIVFRLSSYGISPNRIAVLGVNILIWVNLAWIMVTYIRFLKNKVQISRLLYIVAKYLPVYGIWTALVVFTFPILFN